MAPTVHELEQIYRRHSKAPYNFFRITNYDEARREFLASGRLPEFSYAPGLELASLKARKVELQRFDASGSELFEQFVERRLREVELLLNFAELSASPSDQSIYLQYRETMAELYGKFDPDIFSGILQYLENRAKETNSSDIYNELKSLINRPGTTKSLYRPRPETFDYYKRLLMSSNHPVVKLLAHKPKSLSHSSAISYMKLALDLSGATSVGWQLETGASGAHIRVLRYRKKLVIGEHYASKSLSRLQQLTAHEIFVHVRRAMLGVNSGQHRESEEGVAIMLEQLLGGRFIYRRLVRYFAAALAWGVDGKQRNFRETFELIYRAFMIVGSHDEAEARTRAFNDCVRVFRGGLPGVAGAAFIKDKVYLESNLKVWRDLECNRLSQQDFLKYLDGEMA